MSSQKLTGLTASGVPAAGDLLYVVDISDTTDSANGTSKKVTSDHFLSAFIISKEIDITSAVSPGDVETLLAKCSSTGRPLLIDGDMTLSGDVLVDEPVHIIVQPNVTISMANSPTWDNGVSAADNTRYLGAMFMFRTGAEGSVFDATAATFTVNKDNAGSVSGEDVQPCVVAVFGCDNVTLRGTPIINTAFNGVTVVDSDYFRMMEPWHTVSAENATLDTEASDHGYAIASGKGCEEVIDVQVQCDDWEVHAYGENVTQAVLEINNSHNIRGYSSSLNCQNVDVYDYGDTNGAFTRWSARMRATDWINESHKLVCHARYDSDFSNSSVHETFALTDCVGLVYDCEAYISGTTGRISRVFNLDTGGDNFYSDGKIYVQSDSNNLDAADLAVVSIRSQRRSTVKVSVFYPIAEDQAAVWIGGCQETSVEIGWIYDTGGSGIGVLVDGSIGTSCHLRNTGNISNAATSVDVTGVSAGTLQQYT